MPVFLMILASFMMLGILVSITQVGKERKPVTGSVVVVSSIINLFWIVILVIAAYTWHR